MAVTLAAGAARGEEVAPEGGVSARLAPADPLDERSPEADAPGAPSAQDDVFAMRGPTLESPPPPRASSSSALSWGLWGLAGASALTTLSAVIYREAHARRWNDPRRCLAPGFTRAELCGAERSSVRAGERVALVSGALTVLFALGLAIDATASVEEQPPEARSAGWSCNLDGASLGVSCDSSF